MKNKTLDAREFSNIARCSHYYPYHNLSRCPSQCSSLCSCPRSSLRARVPIIHYYYHYSKRASLGTITTTDTPNSVLLLLVATASLRRFQVTLQYNYFYIEAYYYYYPTLHHYFLGLSNSPGFAFGFIPGPLPNFPCHLTILPYLLCPSSGHDLHISKSVQHSHFFST